MKDINLFSVLWVCIGLFIVSLLMMGIGTEQYPVPKTPDGICEVGTTPIWLNEDTIGCLKDF